MSDRQMTPKQALRAHIETEHRTASKNPRQQLPGPGSTLAGLVMWHGLQHHRFSPNHYHEGVNLGPGARPVGWRTGEGSVPIVRKSFR